MEVTHDLLNFDRRSLIQVDGHVHTYKFHVRFQVLTAAAIGPFPAYRLPPPLTTSSLDTYINLDPSVARLTHP
jgi:hypothetical protein